ncbi:hypothetical protein JXA88_13230 [Candidatus Fermentibacteria bacterium]|nr:hypothetical protein [Candidatus Fermentibacteria bacterium]
MDEWMNGRMDEWMNGRMDEWMIGWEDSSLREQAQGFRVRIQSIMGWAVDCRSSLSQRGWEGFALG